VSDLIPIRGLIKQSFAAMEAHAPSGTWEMWAESIVKEGDLREDLFVREYLSDPATYFVVADDSELGVIGCCGIKVC
jgi:hypothetical protein